MLTKKLLINTKIFYFILLCLIFFIEISDFRIVEASNSEVYIETILPENQLDKTVKYFDLRMKPSEEQVVKIKIANPTSESIKFKLVYSNAKTTSEGVVEYSENQELKINTPKGYSFEEIISGPKEIIVPKKESVTVDLLLKMPNEIYRGVIVGGVEFIQEIKKSDESSLISQRSYLVGFKLSETDEEVPININAETSFVGLKNYKSAIITPLTNLNGNYIENLSVKTTIKRKDEQVVILQNQKTNMRVAPFSTLDFPTYIDETFLETGDYEITVIAKAESFIEKEWNQSFKVTPKDSLLVKENKDLWEDSQSEKSVKVIVFLIFGITVVTVLVLILTRRKIKERTKKSK